MKCPECSGENPKNSKFCKECGHTLEKKVKLTDNTCENCLFVNQKGSKYCQECGEKLSSHEESSVEKFDALLKNDIDDIIFRPKKRSRVKRVVQIVLFSFAVIVAVIFLAVLYDSASSDPALSEVSAFENVSVEDAELEWYGEELYFTGILKNTGYEAVNEVKVRIDFYRDEEGNNQFDTRTVTVGSVEPYGAFSFEVPLTAYPEGDYWWVYNISEVNN